MAKPDRDDWLKAYLRVQQKADRQVLIILEDSLKSVNKMLKELAGRPGIGAAVRTEQLQAVRRQLLRELAEIYRKVGLVIEAARIEAAAAAIKLNGDITNTLFKGAPPEWSAYIPELREGMAQAALRTLDAATARALSPNGPVPLSQRIYRSQAWTQNRIERIINSALARGLSVREFAKEVRPFFSPDVPGGTRYAALRLARTEVNAAYHTIARNQMVDVPWAEGMKWHLSRSHPKKDDCDVLATQDAYDLGPGVYPVVQTPDKPHPQCFCFTTPVVTDEDLFLDRLVAGRYDDYIRRTTGLP